VLICGARNGPDYHRKENVVKNNNRVLARIQARDLTEREMQVVNGGQVRTLTICTSPNASAFAKDGDVGEC